MLTWIIFPSKWDVETGQSIVHRGHGYILTGNVPLHKSSYEVFGDSLVCPLNFPLLWSKGKGPQVEACWSDRATRPPMAASTCCVTIHHLLGRTLDGWGALWWTGMWNEVCVRLHTESCMCERTYIWMCGDNDVRDNKDHADELSQAFGHRGQKHGVCECVCVIICECIGWERVLFF